MEYMGIFEVASLPGLNAVRELAPEEAERFRAALGRMQDAAHANAVRSGFWEDGNGRRDPLQKLYLMIEEVVEAGTAVREGTAQCPCDKAGMAYKLTQIEEECADIAIRLLDFCGAFGIDLGRAIVAKHRYNLTRPFRHGKSC